MSVLGLAAGAAASFIGQMASSAATQSAARQSAAAQQSPAPQLQASVSNIDQAGSSIASAPSITGTIGSKVDITA